MRRSARRPSVPQLAWLLGRDPGGFDDGNLALLGRLKAACPAAVAHPLLREITRIIKEQAYEQLDGWLGAAAASGVPDLVTFAGGLQRERTGLLAALSLP